MTNTITVPSDRRGLKFIFQMKKDLLGTFIRMMQKEGDFAWYKIGREKILMLNDARGIEHVFKGNANNYKKSKFYKVLRPFLGNSILLSNGETWRKQRRDSTPVFTQKYFEEITPLMVEATEAMFARWAPRLQRQEPIDLNFETMWFTLDVLMRTLFHETREDIALQMQIAITTILREAEERVWAPVSLPQWLTFSLPKYRNALKFLNSTIRELVTARKENRSYPSDLLSRLIASHGSTFQEQRYLRDQVMTFLLAGHETTANGLVWACYYLSTRPEVWRKMQAEVDRVVTNGPISLNHVKELVYTRQVFDEVLRFHPIVWTMSRDSLDEDEIPLENGDKINLPKGTTVMLCTYAVHRRELYWKNPEVFDPERFRPEAVLARPNFAYFPFGGGPRQCIGIRFAQIESVIALALLAKHYDLALVSGQNTSPLANITLRPSGPMLFRITLRENAVQESLIHEEPSPKSLKCPFHDAAE